VKTDPVPPDVQVKTKLVELEMTKKLYGWEIYTVEDKVRELTKSALPLAEEVMEEDFPIEMPLRTVGLVRKIG